MKEIQNIPKGKNTTRLSSTRPILSPKNTPLGRITTCHLRIKASQVRLSKPRQSDLKHCYWHQSSERMSFTAAKKLYLIHYIRRRVEDERCVVKNDNAFLKHWSARAIFQFEDLISLFMHVDTSAFVTKWNFIRKRWQVQEFGVEITKFYGRRCGWVVILSQKCSGVMVTLLMSILLTEQLIKQNLWVDWIGY